MKSFHLFTIRILFLLHVYRSTLHLKNRLRQQRKSGWRAIRHPARPNGTIRPTLRSCWPLSSDLRLVVKTIARSRTLCSPKGSPFPTKRSGMCHLLWPDSFPRYSLLEGLFTRSWLVQIRSYRSALPPLPPPLLFLLRSSLPKFLNFPIAAPGRGLYLQASSIHTATMPAGSQTNWDDKAHLDLLLALWEVCSPSAAQWPAILALLQSKGYNYSQGAAMCVPMPFSSDTVCISPFPDLALLLACCCRSPTRSSLVEGICWPIFQLGPNKPQNLISVA